MIEAGLRVTINTDDPGASRASFQNLLAEPLTHRLPSYD